MKLLVTGGAGYIGSVAAEQLLGAGHEVIVIDDLSRGHRQAVPKGAELVVGDLSEKEILAALFRAHRFDAVLHFAAFIEAGESMKFPERFFRNNTANALAVLEAMIAAARKPFCLFIDGGSLWQSRQDADSGRGRAAADQCLWRIKAAGGANAGVVPPDSWAEICKLAVFQCRWRRRTRSRRSAPAGVASCAAADECRPGAAEKH